MFLSPYQTSPCRDFILTKTVEEVMVARIDGALLRENWPIEMVGPASVDVPIFTQPLTRLEFGTRKDVPEVVFDARSMLRLGRPGDNKPYVVTNYSEMEFTLNRTRLLTYWLSDGFDKLDMLRAGDLVPLAFIQWISRTLAGRLHLDPEHQMQIEVISAFYYCALHYEERMFDDQVRSKVAQQIARWTRVPAQKVFEITDQVPYLANIKDFVDALKKNVATVRMEQLSVAFLYALLGGGWFGANRNEIVCVALEHPPTWVALVYTSLQQRGYRNATIAKVVEKATRGGNDKDFVKSLQFMMRELTSMDRPIPSY